MKNQIDPIDEVLAQAKEKKHKIVPFLGLSLMSSLLYH
jgi:hypothetical protein